MRYGSPGQSQVDGLQSRHQSCVQKGWIEQRICCCYFAKLLGDRTEAQDVAQNAFVRIQSAVNDGRAREPRLLQFSYGCFP